MKPLEIALEFLRPLIDSKNWDYCVVWNLANDPSRFIEWMGCCCSGAGEVEKRSRIENETSPFCRDLYLKHQITTKACEALASFPAFIPLYSEGVHCEAVTSNQSKWLNHLTSPDSSSYNENVGTRVLIPVLGGLIELFSAKHIAKDQKIIDYITANCNVLKQESMVANFYSGLNEFGLDPFLDQNMHTLPAPSHLLRFLPRTDIVIPSFNQSNTYFSPEGTSGCLEPSDDHRSLHPQSGYFSQNGILKHSIENPSGGRKSKSNENSLMHQDRIPGSKIKVSKATNKPEFQSKNLIAERNRRNRITNGILTLRSLVPKISKMNKVATLGDAINFIRELEEEAKNLKDELKELEEEESEFRERNAELTTPRSETSLGDKEHLPCNEMNRDSDHSCETKKIEGQIEVKLIGKREFLIKVFSEKKKGGFGRLIDLIYSLGLQVVNVNMTTCNCQVLTVLTVEASKEVHPKKLRESLLKLGG
ncbi:basic helix-loop-helix (bHLH) DNA-binding superfamily protein [Euphorbia peplus]|nr:basic helix-loop-helix (bHLH) DNA-binding superfamily protein [Euphorbia peplus]